MADSPAGDHYQDSLGSAEDQAEYDLVMKHVNRAPSGPTEADEEDVLRERYGAPEDDGVYHGGGEDE